MNSQDKLKLRSGKMILLLTHPIGCLQIQGLGKSQIAEQTKSNHGKHDGSSHALLIGQCEMPSIPQIFFAFRNVVHAGSGGNRFETSK
jgi:hypothetical protein